MRITLNIGWEHKGEEGEELSGNLRSNLESWSEVKATVNYLEKEYGFTQAKVKSGRKPKTQKMYCVKCREQREGKGVQEVTIKNGKKALRAFCEICGTTMFKIPN